MIASLFLALLAGPLPLEPGTWWEYRESYTESLNGVYSTSEEVARFEIRARRRGPYLEQTGGADPTSGPIERGDQWIRMGAFTGEEPLPLPLEVGREGPSEGGAGWKVEEEEEVTVPAGAYRALRCAIRTWRSVSILWIAPGVGVVRQIEGAPDAPPEMERVLLRHGAAPGSPGSAPGLGGQRGKQGPEAAQQLAGERREIAVDGLYALPLGGVPRAAPDHSLAVPQQ
jgi:hypothetical protein